MTPHEFAHELEKVCEGNLESVVLYGSAVDSDFSEEYSDYNLIVILKDPSPANLAKTGKPVCRWLKRGNPAPHFFDMKHIEQSLDVFPLEFLDIADRHKVLFGTDPFKNIKVDRSNLRHQCESELKGKVLDLRALFIVNHRHPKRVSKIMLKTLPSFLSIFRGVVHLLGKTPERDLRKLLEQMNADIDFNPQIFMDLIDVREGTSFLPRKDEALAAFEKYLTEIQAITNYVDRLK